MIFQTYENFSGEKKVGLFTTAKRVNDSKADLQNLDEYAVALSKLTPKTEEANAVVQKLKDSTVIFSSTWKSKVDQAFGDNTGDNVEEISKQIGKLHDEIESTETVTRKSGGIKTFFSGLGGSLKSIGKNLLASVGSGLATGAISFGVNLIFDGIVNGISYLINRKSILTKQAAEAASQVGEELASIDDYKSQIETLKTSLDVGNLAQSEAYDARAKLLSIQDALIDKYGAEAAELDLLGGSLDVVNAKMDELAKQKMSEWLADNAEAIDDSVDYMTEQVNNKFYAIQLSKPARGQGEILSDMANRTLQSIAEKYGAEFNDYNATFNVGYGTRDEFKEKFTGIRNAIATFKQSKDLTYEEQEFLSNMLTAMSEEQDRILADYEEKAKNFETAGEYAVKTYSKYSDIYKEITSAKEKYEEAVTNGDTDSLLSVINDIADIENGMSNIDFSGKTGEAAKQYLEGITENLTIEGKKSLLGINLQAKTKEVAGLRKELEKVGPDLAKVFAQEDIEFNALDDSELDKFAKLQQYAEKFGMSVADIVSAAQNVGLCVEPLEYFSEEVGTLTDQTAGLATEFENVNKILSSQQAGMSISVEDFQSEDLEDYRSALENVNGTMRLNRDKIREIIRLKAEEQIANNDLKRTELHDTYRKNATAIDELIDKLNSKKYADEKEKNSIQQNIQSLKDENAALIAQCDQLDLLDASLREAAGAYQAWLDAQKLPDKGDMFDDALAMLKYTNEVLNDPSSDNYNDIGTDKFKAAVEFLIPDTVDQDDVSAVQSYLNKISNLFTTKDGEKNGLNLDEFCNQAVESGLMTVDASGKKFELAGEMTMEKFADGMGLSLPLVQAMIDELEAKGNKFEFEYDTLPNLAVAADKATSALSKIKSFEKLNLKLDVTDLESTDEKVAALQKSLKAIQKWKGKVKLDASQAEQVDDVIEYITAQLQSLQEPVVMKVDTSSLTGDVKSAIVTIQNFYSAYQEYQALLNKVPTGQEPQGQLKVDISEAKEKVTEAKGDLKKLAENPTIQKYLKIDTSSIDKAAESISGITKDDLLNLNITPDQIFGELPDEEKISITVNDKEIDEANKKMYDLTHPDPANIRVDLNPIYQAISSFQQYLNAHPFKSTIQVTTEESGGSKAGGTTKDLTGLGNSGSGSSNGFLGSGGSTLTPPNNLPGPLGGKSKATGDWITKTGERALVGELGREIVVDTNTGRWHTVGDNGAEFAYIPKGAIVFNHKQTETLLKRGWINDRGTALARGTAYATKITGATIDTSRYNSAGNGSGSGNGNGNGSGGNGNGDSGSDNDSGTNKALEKFKNWFEKLFDWIEIKLQRQTDKISDYVDAAERSLDSGKFATSSKNYLKAIKETETQLSYERTASSKYLTQAESVLKKAVSSGAITSKQADNIRSKVKSGSMVISQYGEAMRDVISSYQEWYDKSRDASRSISELHANLREYVKSLREVRTAQAEAKIEGYTRRLDISTSGYTSTSAGFYRLAAGQQRSTMTSLQNQNAASYAGVTNFSSDVSSLRSAGRSKVASALKSKTAKKSASYRKALKNAQNAIKKKTKISSSDLSVIKKYNPDVYYNLDVYNVSMDELEDLRLEYAVTYAANSAEIFDAKAEQYNLKREAMQTKADRYADKAELYQSRNGLAYVTPNSYLDKEAAQYDKLVKASQEAVSSFTKSAQTKQNKIIKARNNETWKGTRYTTTDTSTRNQVRAAIRNAYDCAKKGVAIGPTTLKNLAVFQSRGYVTTSFYESCVAYNDALEHRREAEAQLEIDKLTREQEQSAIATQKVENVQNKYENYLNQNANRTRTFESNQTLDTTRGLYLQEGDYRNLLKQSLEDERLYTNEASALRKTIAENLSKGYWTETSQGYLDAMQALSDTEDQIIQCRIAQEEYNNSIAELPYEELERELAVLDSWLKRYEAFANSQQAKSIDLEEIDYQRQMDEIDKELENKREALRQAQEDILKAQSNPDGVYGGKDVDEWQKRINEFQSDIYELESSNEQLKDSLRDDVYWRDFERAHDSAQRFLNLLTGIAELIDSSTFIDDDTGLFTNFGVTRVANLIKTIEETRKEVQNYSNDIANLNSLYEQGWYTELEYKEKLGELQEDLLNSASSVKSYVDSLIDLYKDQAQSELDVIFELIDARNEALRKKKEYYDYDKTIRSKTKDIQSLQAQIAALEGVETAEAKAKRAKLEADLADKRDDLKDTVDNHILEISEDALAEMRDALQDAFDEHWNHIWNDLDAVKELLAAANTVATESAATITDTLEQLLDFFKINPSNTGIDAAYASGTRRVPKRMRALTNESGNEIIVTKRGMITPLDRGDGVLPTNLTNRLYDLAMNGMPDVTVKIPDAAMKNVQTRASGHVNITQQYDSLIHIDGSADAATVEDLKKYGKDFLKQSYEYTSQKLYNGYIKAGGKRKV